MKTKLLILSVLLATINSYNLNAQDKYLKGYIIKNQDTVHCYIKKASAFEMESVISVKTDLEDKGFTNYKPSQIDGFYTQNFGYFSSESFTYRRVNDIMKSGSLSDAEVPVFYKSTSFLRMPVSGEVSLFIFIDSKQKKHFFVKKDTLFKELYVKKKFATKTVNNKKVTGLVTQKKYIGILITFFNDCPEVKNKLIHTELRESDLIKITNQYNKCKNPENYQENRVLNNKKIIFKKSVFAGGISNQYKITGIEHDWAFRTQYNTPLTYTFGANFDFTFPELSYKLSIGTGISYYYTPYTFQYDTIISTVNYHYEGDMSTQYLKIPVLIKYTFNKNKLQPYFFAGLFFNIILDSKNTLTIHKYSGFKDITESQFIFGYTDGTTGDYKSAVKSIENGYSLGAGIKFKISDKLAVYSEFNLGKGNGISSLGTFGFKSTYMHLIAGIEF